MTVIENINIAYVSQDLSLLSSADADGTKDLRYLSVLMIRYDKGVHSLLKIRSDKDVHRLLKIRYGKDETNL